MWFGKVAVADGEGSILAHGVKAAGLAYKKGRVLDSADLAALAAAGVAEVTVARLDAGDCGEDGAAGSVARAAAGSGVDVAPPFTGRANILAGANGLVVLDEARIHALNAIDEAVTLATLPAHAVVRQGQMVATVKIIPFAVPAPLIARVREVIGNEPLVRVAAFRPLRVRLVQTVLAGVAGKVHDKTSRITAARLDALGGSLIGESRCPHGTRELAAGLRELPDDWDMLLIVGASAITDRRDVVPAAIEAVGGSSHHLGMPVDPGNLLLLAEIAGRPVLGLPGCARSPAPNGFDWVIQRLVAGLEVTPSDIRRMGVGGLLVELPSRPQPREMPRPAPAAGRAPRLGALILAAGRSQRMGERNKLLIEVDGQPMVRHAALAALAAGLEPILVVTGHAPDAVEAALHGLPVRFVHNPDHRDGLSTSLRAGLEALGETGDGVVVCLGDMPQINRAHLDRLIAAFAPADGRSIVVPTHHGRRGNPVLWSRRYFPQMRALEGDVGARHLFAQHAADVHEVEMDDDATLVDVDTPEALAALTKELA